MTTWRKALYCVSVNFSFRDSCVLVYKNIETRLYFLKEYSVSEKEHQGKNSPVIVICYLLLFII